MSLILEALKKSETRRRLGEAPDIGTPFTVKPRRRNPWPLIVIAIAVAAGVGWWYARTVPRPNDANTVVSLPSPPAPPAVGKSAADARQTQTPAAKAGAAARESAGVQSRPRPDGSVAGPTAKPPARADAGAAGVTAPGGVDAQALRPVTQHFSLPATPPPAPATANPNPANVPVLWLGTAERISVVVEMNHPGVWILGDLADDDRRHGMGIVVEYAHQSGKPQWSKPAPFRWSYTHFAKPGAYAPAADETFDMTFAKDNAAEEGFNRWTINGVAYPMSNEMVPASFHLKQGKRYRIRMRNASDDIHPIHFHRHSFELTNLAGMTTAGIMKDVVMLGGYQQYDVDFVADNPGLTLFHCHQQLHMDYGFMTLFDYT